MRGMKFVILLTSLGCLMFACNNADVKQKAKTDSSKDEAAALIEDLQKKVQRYPDSSGLRMQFAAALDSVGMYRQALAQMDSLIAKDSLNYGLWLTKGTVAEEAQDTLLAMRCYANAAHVYETPEALLRLANLYAETKNDRAIQICSRVKGMGLGRDNDANCAFIVGVYYARTHNLTEAMKYFDECIANNYTYMEAYIEKGLLFFDNKQYEKALQVFQFAATVNNLYADAYYYQARCYEMMNKKDSAVLRFKQSLQLDPGLKEASERLKELGGE